MLRAYLRKRVRKQLSRALRLLLRPQRPFRRLWLTAYMRFFRLALGVLQ